MKIKSFLTTIVVLILVNLNCFAQLENPGCGDGGGGPDDPTNCPLDSWVMLLVVATLIFTAFHLYRIQKHQQKSWFKAKS